MGLRDRLVKSTYAAKSADKHSKDKDNEDMQRAKRMDAYQELKLQLHRQLIEKIDLAKLMKIGEERAREQIRSIIKALLIKIHTPLNSVEREELIAEIEDETFGLGPLEPLLHDPNVDDILVNNPKQVYVEKFGKLELTNIVFRDNAHLMQIIERIVTRVGRRVDESSPMVDARLPDGARVNVIIPPLALNGPVLSIRRFKRNPLKMKDLIHFKTLTSEIAAFLEAAVKARMNILISGGTGSGKTTLLDILSGYIPNAERVVTIEDAAELQLHKSHVIRLEIKPPNIEGKGEITQRDLVRNTLRMRPDRIIVGEVRGPEALDMLQAMNTGHLGSMSTIHANSPRDALSRLETMILMTGTSLTERAMRQQIASAINIVIQLDRCSDGVRRVVSISEILGRENDVIKMQDIFVFKQEGISTYGGVVGNFVATGVKPKLAHILESKGLKLPASIFKVAWPTR